MDIAPTIAIDIDPRAASALAESAPRAAVEIGDVLKTGLNALLDRLESPRVIVSNLPYYITAAVVERICDVSDRIAWAVLMMQSEVADKLAAGPGASQRGSLSVFVQWHFAVTAIARVPPGAFFPPPKVESKVLKLQSRERRDDNGALALVRAGFRQPRKTLANNLLTAGLEREGVAAALEESGLSPLVRPHSLREEDWIALAGRVRIPTS